MARQIPLNNLKNLLRIEELTFFDLRVAIEANDKAFLLAA
jgi:hypothetical protein